MDRSSRATTSYYSIAQLYFAINFHRAKSHYRQVTTVLATSKHILFPDHNHLLTTGIDDPSLKLSPECQWLAW